MNHKIVPLILGFILALSLGLGGMVFAQAPTQVVHQTGDILMYSIDGEFYEYHYSYNEIFDEDIDILIRTEESSNDFDGTSSGDASIILVDAADLPNLPAEIDPAQNPDWPEGVDLLGALIESEGTSSGTAHADHRVYDYYQSNDTNAGWFNFTDTRTFGPEQFFDREQQGGFALDGFSFLPMFGDDLNAMDVINGENFTETIRWGFPLGDFNWIELNVTLTASFDSFFDVSLADNAGGTVIADMYTMYTEINGSVADYPIQIPIGDPWNLDSPKISANATFDFYVDSFFDLYIDRDSRDGVFLGFYEDEYSDVWGYIEAANQTVWWPHDDVPQLGLDDHNSTLSFYSEFSNDRFQSQDVFLDDFLVAAAPSGDTGGLNAGDTLKYHFDDRTEIRLEQSRIEEGAPGEGPDFENPRYKTEAFDARVDAEGDFWLHVYTNTNDRVGFVTETLYTDFVATGFGDGGDGGEGGLALDQEGDGPGVLYFFDIAPLITGAVDSGLGSSASMDLILPYETEQGIRESQLFQMGDRDDGDDDGGPLGFIYEITRGLNISLRAPVSSSTTGSGIGNITINNFDYVVEYTNESKEYTKIWEGTAPFTFDDGPDDQPPQLGLDQDGPPAAYMDYYIELDNQDVRYYDANTGALLYKSDNSGVYVHMQVYIELGEPFGDVLAFETEIWYDWENGFLLEEHPFDYQVAQDPSDIPTSETTDDSTNTTTSTTDTSGNDTTSETDTSQDTPDVSLPGFGFATTIVASGIMVMFVRKRKL